MKKKTAKVSDLEKMVHKDLQVTKIPAQLQAVIDKIQYRKVNIPFDAPLSAAQAMMTLSQDYTDAQWKKASLSDLAAQVFYGVDEKTLQKAFEASTEDTYKRKASRKAMKFIQSGVFEEDSWTRDRMDYRVFYADDMGFHEERDLGEEFQKYLDSAEQAIVQFGSMSFTQSLTSPASILCQEQALDNIRPQMDDRYHRHDENKMLNEWQKAVLKKSDAEIIGFAEQVQKRINSQPTIHFSDYNGGTSMKKAEYHFKPWDHVLRYAVQKNKASLIDVIPKDNIDQDILKTIVKDATQNNTQIKSKTMIGLLKKFKTSQDTAHAILYSLLNCVKDGETSFVDPLVQKFKRYLTNPFSNDYLGKRVFSNLFQKQDAIKLTAFMQHPLLKQSMLQFIKDNPHQVNNEASPGLLDTICLNVAPTDRHEIYNQLLQDGNFHGADVWVKYIDDPNLEQQTHDHVLKYLENTAPHIAALLNKKHMNDILADHLSEPTVRPQKKM